MNKGFTLIELLVVVLIIGILAAIALPQYQKAVERSRMAEAVQTLGDLATAQSVYYMQNSTFADGFTGAGSIADGDVVVSEPTGNAFAYDVEGDDDGATMTAVRQSGIYGQEGNQGTLTLEVEPSGAISKTCTGPEDFCNMAETAGYVVDQYIGGVFPPGWNPNTGGAEICEKCGSGGSIVLEPEDPIIINPGGSIGSKCKLLGTC